MKSLKRNEVVESYEIQYTTIYHLVSVSSIEHISEHIRAWSVICYTKNTEVNIQSTP
jgi:hypothetical protein